ncbi:hypothetical protein ACNHKD_04235 [Methylocystis sp. JAN1]|uniref:hypothetical protein n=1 Tax=Methylocystis sp. JAN1 TaxID=3397211 RepID=UPI003FA25896
MEREALVGEIFEAAYDVNRASLAAMVAIGAEDFGLAREQLGMLVADVKLLARLWDRLEQGGAA